MKLLLARTFTWFVSLSLTLTPATLFANSGPAAQQPASSQGETPGEAATSTTVVVAPGQSWSNGYTTVHNDPDSGGVAIVQAFGPRNGWYRIELRPGFKGDVGGLLGTPQSGGDVVDAGGGDVTADISAYGGTVNIGSNSEVVVTNPDLSGTGNGPSTTVNTPTGSTQVAPGSSQPFST